MKIIVISALVIGPAGTRVKANIQTSDDLPADAIGEVVTEALQMAQKAGVNPLSSEVRLSFFS